MKIKLKNRLEVLMRDSGVRSIEEMAQRLNENQRYKITRTPLSRKFKDDDVTLPLSLIEAICNELQCLPGDLFETNVTDATEGYVDEMRSRLQPFRYGSMRLRKAGSAAVADPESEPSSAAQPGSTPKPARHKVSASVEPELDDIAGPKVTHMNIEALKKKT